MEEMRPLSPKELDKVSGGKSTTTITRDVKVYSKAGQMYPLVTTLSHNTFVVWNGKTEYNDRECTRFYYIILPVHGWVRECDIDK